jgi:hypothetical protein
MKRLLRGIKRLFHHKKVYDFDKRYICSHPVMTYYCPKNMAADLTVAPERDEMDIRPVQLSAYGKDTYFVPCSHKDGQGRQMGVLCNNRLGLMVMDPPIDLVYLPCEKCQKRPSNAC